MQGKSDGLNLPVAEVAGEVQHALALPIRLLDVLLALDLHALEHLFVRQCAEPDQLEQQACRNA